VTIPKSGGQLDVPPVVLSLLVHEGSLRSCSGTSPDGAQGAQQPPKVVLAEHAQCRRQRVRALFTLRNGSLQM
jgi:hypothetical protein